MLAFLSNILGNKEKSLGVAVHIGAGVGRELEIYNAMNFSRIVAVEPDPTLFDKLNRKSKRFEHVQVKNVWVAPKTGETSIYCFANPRFNSLLAPDQLTEHFSNLKQCEQKSSMAEGINDFIENLQPLDPNKVNVLIFDVQGAESNLFSECSQDNLNQFDWVIVRTSQESLYKNSTQANELIKTLATRNLTLRFTDDENVPYTEHYYQRDQNAITIKQLESKLLESQQNNSELTARYEEAGKANLQAKQDINDLNVKLKELSGNTTAKEKELADKKALVEQLKEQIAKLTESTQQQLEVAEQKAKKALQDLANKQIEFEKAQQQIESLSKQLAEKAQQLTKLEAESQETQQRLERENNELSQSVETQKKTVQLLEEKAKHTEDAAKLLRDEKQTLVEQFEEQSQKVQAQQEKAKQAEDKYTQLQGEKQALIELAEEQKQATQESIKLEEAKVRDLQSELAKTKKQLEQQTQWHHQNKDRVENLNKQMTELKQQVLERQKASDMAIKLQTKAQVDLEDLREKYKNKNYNEQQLVELVKELRVKLKQAAEFYHYLENNHPELAELDYADTTASLVKAPKTKKSAKSS
ncbi:FkbM family methyltransferase [Aliiglaciecola litoralis]|uniref:Methyltransferase FkbM domain-containing protein n=1 Tax=Aliiglaciecola litoralis TaxID=582857 RepID=A0ABP3WUB8_9ALTE